MSAPGRNPSRNRHGLPISAPHLRSENTQPLVGGPKRAHMGGMGSFSMTCAVSGLTIEEGDPIRAFLLTENPYAGDGVHYIHGLWASRTWPLRATYADYGHISHVERGPVADAWVEGLRIDMGPTAPSTFDELVDRFNTRQELRVRRSSPVHSVFRRKTRWAHALGDGAPTDLFGEEPDDGRTLALGMAMIREDVWQSLCKISIPFDLSIGNLITQAKHAWSSTLDDWIMMGGSGRHSSAFSRDDLPNVLGLASSFRLVRDIAETDAEDRFVTDAAEFIYLSVVMDGARLLWRPSYSAGPQFGEWRLHATVLDAFAAIADAKATAYEASAEEA